jgi:hypothetical protein
LDKYTAADVLREVSSYDLIDRGGGYSGKIRKLGEWHPAAARGAKAAPDAGDIDDPLYGNGGGPAELARVRAAAEAAAACALGLAAWLAETRGRDADAAAGEPGGMRAALRTRVLALEPIAWLVPPMLSPRTNSSSPA